MVNHQIRSGLFLERLPLRVRRSSQYMLYRKSVNVYIVYKCRGTPIFRVGIY